MIGEEVVDDGIEVLGREYLGGRIGISEEIVEVSGGVVCDTGSEALGREGSDNISLHLFWFLVSNNPGCQHHKLQLFPLRFQFYLQDTLCPTPRYHHQQLPLQSQQQKQLVQ